MTIEDFDGFVASNNDLKYQPGRLIEGQFKPTDPELGEGIAFCWPGKGMPYYDSGNIVFVEGPTLAGMSPNDLESQLIKGHRVEGITRITGYFTKLSSWNKGKLGELKDRNKNLNRF